MDIYIYIYIYMYRDYTTLKRVRPWWQARHIAAGQERLDAAAARAPHLPLHIQHITLQKVHHVKWSEPQKVHHLRESEPESAPI